MSPLVDSPPGYPGNHISSPLCPHGRTSRTHYVRSCRVAFPRWFGKNSARRKRTRWVATERALSLALTLLGRLLGELAMHVKHCVTGGPEVALTRGISSWPQTSAVRARAGRATGLSATAQGAMCAASAPARQGEIAK